MYHLVAYVARCVQNISESLGLKALDDFDVGIRGRPSQIYLSCATFVGYFTSLSAAEYSASHDRINDELVTSWTAAVVT
jgi:hypothetical protein